LEVELLKKEVIVEAFKRKNLRLVVGVNLAAVLFLVTAITVYYFSKNRYDLATKAIENPASLRLAPSESNLQVGEAVTIQVFLLPNDNQVSSVDLVLRYDPAYLAVDETLIRPVADSGFLTYHQEVEADNGVVRFSALTYDGSAPTTPVSGTGAVYLVDVPFRAVALTPAGQPVTVGIEYVEGATYDSNVSVINQQGALDVLQTPETVVHVSVLPESTPTPTPPPSVPTTPPIPTTYPSIAPTLPSGCGDGVCAGQANGEDCFSCPADCRCFGKECDKACCGNDICEKFEKTKSCPVDCP
jgi:hypothetical protein